MTKRIVARALSVLLVFALTACSGAPSGTPTTGASSQPGGSSQPSASSKTYKIAVTAPLTGNNAEGGQNFDVASQMAIDEINAAGGIGGVMLERVIYDTKADPKEAVDIARRIAQDDSVLAVVGAFSSSCSMAAAPIYEEAGIVQLSPSATHTDFVGLGDYQFSIMGRQSAEAPFYADVILNKYLGAKSVGVMYLNNDWGNSVYSNFSAKCEEIGIDITAAEIFSEEDNDFTASLSKVRQSNPEALCVVAFYQQAAQILLQVEQMGWEDVTVVSMGVGYNSVYADLTKDVKRPVYSGSMYVLNLDNPAEKAFYDEFVSRTNNALEPTVLGFCAYDTVYMLKNCIQQLVDGSSEVTRSGIRDKLAAMTDFVGLTGPIPINPEGDVTRKYRVTELVNGEWTVMTDYDYY